MSDIIYIWIETMTLGNVTKLKTTNVISMKRHFKICIQLAHLLANWCWEITAREKITFIFQKILHLQSLRIPLVKKIVWKSTVLWLLLSNPSRLSSDRLVRVKLSDLKNHAKAVVQEKRSLKGTSEYQFFRRQSEISIGEWCFCFTSSRNW